MTTPRSCKLILEAVTKSKAKLWKLIPMKSVIEGEEFDISFRLENIGERDFPCGQFNVKITWASGQWTRIEDLDAPPLKIGETKLFPDPKPSHHAMADGYALVHVEDFNMKQEKEEDSSPKVDFFTRKHRDKPINIRKASISAIKVKIWEEIYEFSALIVAAISLAIIALEKAASWLMTWIA